MVRSSYRVLKEILLLNESLSVLQEGVFGNLWKSPAPSKVVAFLWALLLDRIPTRSNLAFRHVLDPGGAEYLCVVWTREETTTHLFLHCEVVSRIWRKVLD